MTKKQLYRIVQLQEGVWGFLHDGPAKWAAVRVFDGNPTAISFAPKFVTKAEAVEYVKEQNGRIER